VVLGRALVKIIIASSSLFLLPQAALFVFLPKGKNYVHPRHHVDNNTTTKSSALLSAIKKTSINYTYSFIL
jgi:hypothetical protein